MATYFGDAEERGRTRKQPEGSACKHARGVCQHSSVSKENAAAFMNSSIKLLGEEPEPTAAEKETITELTEMGTTVGTLTCPENVQIPMFEMG